MKLKLILLAALFAPILAFATPADAAPAHDDQIERLYLTVLGRTPDAAGLVYWADRRVDGETLEDLTRTFLTYPEVELRSSGDLLVDAYRNALHREPDAAGYAYWSTIDPVVAVLMISESLEHQITTGTLPPPAEHVTVAASYPAGWVDAGNGVYVPPILLRIRFCESRDNYVAANPYSSARGGYQFLTSSWAAYGHSSRYGVSYAHFATPAQQDEAAVITWQRDGTRPWNASSYCWG